MVDDSRSHDAANRQELPPDHPIRRRVEAGSAAAHAAMPSMRIWPCNIINTDQMRRKECFLPNGHEGPHRDRDGSEWPNEGHGRPSHA